MRAGIVLALLIPLALAGCLREFEDPHHLQVVNVDLQPAQVLSRDVILNVTTSLDNRGGGSTDEVRLQAKAYNEATGFLLSENETTVGVIPGDTTREVSVRLQVPREGSVRVEVAIFEDDLGRQRASVYARNLGALEPEVVDTGLSVSDVDFLVQQVLGDGGNGSRVQVQTDLYLTNEGRDPSENLRLQVKAREVSTRLIADVQWLDTTSIAPATTVIRSVNLTVPDEYNYVFEILTWRGDVILARNEGIVQLAPTFQKPEDQEVVTTNPNVNDFLARPTMTTSPTSYAPGRGFAGDGAYEPTPRVPGFTAVGAIAAVALAVVVLARRSRQ